MRILVRSQSRGATEQRPHVLKDRRRPFDGSQTGRRKACTGRGPLEQIDLQDTFEGPKAHAGGGLRYPVRPRRRADRAQLPHTDEKVEAGQIRARIGQGHPPNGTGRANLPRPVTNAGQDGWL